MLLFRRRFDTEPVQLPAGLFASDCPWPDPRGLCRAADELPAWEKRLGDHRLAIESRTRLARGGRSIYFRDPTVICWNWSHRAFWAYLLELKWLDPGWLTNYGRDTFQHVVVLLSSGTKLWRHRVA